MIPIGAEATDAVLARGLGLHRGVALRHAALRRRPGLRGDDPVAPSSVVWLRDGGPYWEAFAAGVAGPALAWLERAATGRRVVLAAPASWEGVARGRLDPRVRVERAAVQVWLRPASAALPVPAALPAPTRPLGRGDRDAFLDLAPAWAFRSWGGFATLVTRGLAVGVPRRDGGLAAAAWVVEADRRFAKVGVATDPRLRRLGLGRAAASALVARIEASRRREALWAVHPDHAASIALARSLGFAPVGDEPLLWWDPA